MQTLITIFGQGKDLTTLQMVCRGFVVFVFAYLVVRISGRRSFGIRAPLDIIINILLGSILSRAVVGASPFIPVIATCIAIVILHRLLSWLLVNHEGASKLIEGRKIMLFENGKFIQINMNKALVCEEDILQGVRKSALTENMNTIDKVYIERNGEITAIKKNQD